jgi:hypothetical protein
MKDLSHANRIALLTQAARKEFPGAEVVEHEGEVKVLVGEPPDDVSVAITHPMLESMSIFELVASVVACAKARGIKSATVLGEEKRAQKT